MLLARPRAQPDECLVSYLIRVSEPNGFRHIGYLLHHAGLNWKNNRAPVHQILTGEFDLSSYLEYLNVEAIRPRSGEIYKSFERVIDTSFVFAKYPKICPECLFETGYCKSNWAFLPVLACGKHNSILVDFNPKTRERLSWYRDRLNPFEGGRIQIYKKEGCPRKEVVEISCYFESIMSGNTTSNSIPAVFRGLTFKESLTAMNLICHYQARMLGDASNLVSIENVGLANHYYRAWNLFRDWPDSFYALLSQYIDKPMSKRGQAGINKHYRDLYERLHRQSGNRGVARIKVEFDRYIETYWPGFVETSQINRITFSSSSRNIISKKEAARIIDSRPERIDKFVQTGMLSPVVFKGKAHYLRDKVQLLADLINGNWTMAQACKEFQVTRYQLKQLLDASIVIAIQRPDELNRDWVIDKIQCQSLIATLAEKAKKKQLSGRTVSMAGIQRMGYSIVELLTAMEAGEVEYRMSVDLDHPFSLRQFVEFKVKG